MIILSDASPLISLSKIEQLSLLPALYGSVLVTPQVYAEVAVSGRGLAGSAEIARAGWIHVQPLNRPEELPTAANQLGLGLGEMSTILLAQELKADVVLIDELKARKLARERGLIHLGCVGILEDAFQKNLLADLQQAYQQLLASGTFISRRILEQSLEHFKLPTLRG